MDPITNITITSSYDYSRVVIGTTSAENPYILNALTSLLFLLGAIGLFYYPDSLNN